eukprot:Plantae.Rhodophyta-Hildenbrandia_rubra.ctg29561.p1 GENE.Plantae.Rhodophyta-Hildenbrandia_rubra.ctg29561~~Plantae.Rhodophyta-Hildenbrandia_rubra.ctg29561.p1  ORF type:complete len:310 (+),score=34.91 Plantae.Rhodophyta-Hildenbrandia_rubra.ctg29561:966-1895(+)
MKLFTQQKNQIRMLISFACIRGQNPLRLPLRAQTFRSAASKASLKTSSIAVNRNKDQNATAVIVGASRGIGLALTKEVAKRFDGKVIGLCRRPDVAEDLSDVVESDRERIFKGEIDIENENSVEKAASFVRNVGDNRLDLLINCAGLLWTDERMPETSVTRVTTDFMEQCFRVNTLGAMLVMKHFTPLMIVDRKAKNRVPSVLATISARVGSIEDNKIGGWYSYRVSKAAQNMLTRTASVEMGRKGVIVVGLHPGTVATDLSTPWQKNVKPEKLFKAEDSSRMLSDVIDSLEPQDSGSFRAYDGSTIPF